MPTLVELGPICRDAKRRADILTHPVLNGIDFVEYERRPLAIHKQVLVVTFLKPLPDPPHSDPDGAYGLTLPANLGLVIIQGGTRIVNIRPLEASLVGSRLEIAVSEEGDFSTYVLALGWSLQPDGTFQQQIPALDVQFSIAPINFKAGCPTDFDCRELQICPPDAPAEPVIDYLAKDYASFRQLLIDLIPQLNPGWIERNPSDLGIALLELLAFEGDNLSYFQDAVANEAYLDTARQRASAKKHARLVDYPMHDGRNAWAFVHFEVGSGGEIPLGTKILSRVTAPLRSKSAVPGRGDSGGRCAAGDLRLRSRARPGASLRDRIPAHVCTKTTTRSSCTPGAISNAASRRGLVSLTCIPSPTGPGERQAFMPDLVAGDFLLLEEVMGPKTGAKADADPTHRQVVQLEDVRQMPAGDPAYRDMLTQDGDLQVFRNGDTPLPLLRVTWRRVDALRFPLCLSARIPGRDPSAQCLGGPRQHRRWPITAARSRKSSFRRRRSLRTRYSASGCSKAPLTMQCQPDTVQLQTLSRLARIVTPRTDLTCAVRKAKPAIALLIDFPGSPQQLWEPVPDLLGSPESAPHFTVEVDNDGRPTVRFGDDEYGKRPVGATAFTAVYRIGNGRAGNVGAEALAHAVQPTVAPLWPAIRRIRNPLAAQDGTDAETIEAVRQFAPAEFRAEQFRAVVESDYTAAAKKLAEVAGAVASFRWTGSWYTVFVGVDPRDPDDLITEPGGRTRLAPGLASRVRNFLTGYKLAGYDLEIRSAEYVPLEIAFELCVEPDHFRGDVVEAVRQALSNRVNADGSRGFFHPDNFTFAQNVYLSQIYAAIEAVQGVLSAFVTIFRRFGKTDNGELASGVLPIGPWEIARLDNDPAFQENGVLRITAGGGK